MNKIIISIYAVTNYYYIIHDLIYIIQFRQNYMVTMTQHVAQNSMVMIVTSRPSTHADNVRCDCGFE